MTPRTKIYTEKMRAKVESILKNGHPPHQDRLWLVGFLTYAGYTPDEIMGIIEQGNQWLDYDKKITKYQVESTILGAHRRVPFAKGEDAPRVEASASLSPLPEASGTEVKLSSFESSVYVQCRYVGCSDYGNCHHSHAHLIEAKRVGNRYFLWCGTCPIQEVRCLPIGFDGAEELL